MATFSGSAALVAQSFVYANLKPISVLNKLVPTPGQLETDFTWTPTSGTFSYTVSGNTYVTTCPTTAKNTAITFTAKAVAPTIDVIPVEYYWDFGDGYEGFGPSVQHTFKVGNQGCVVKLRVTDNYGRRWRASHVMCLA